MPLGELTREGIERAITEFDELGRSAFLDKYGFGRATSYALVVNGREYDPKAIAGVAYGFDHPEQGTLANTQFNGGLQLRPAFRGAGYDVTLRTTPGARNVTDGLEQFMAEYLAARATQFSGDAPAQTTLRSIVAAIAQSSALAARPQVRVKGSAGQGNWSAAPWIAMLDRRETDSTQRGVYPVFQFREDMRGVYLTLAQGTTELAQSHGRTYMRDHLAQTAALVAPLVGDDILERDFKIGNDIEIGSGNLARGYEAGTIIYKYYPVGTVPDDEVILRDLDAVLCLMEAYIESKDSAPYGATSTTISNASSIADIAAAFRVAIDESGMRIPTGHGDRVKALVAALIAKPFVILSGLSGSGKTQLALRLGEWLGTGPRGRRFLPVAVRPDWTGPEALFGYEDALRPPLDGRAAWFAPETLRFMLAAAAEPDMPYLLLLDEMNLAHVERYFSDFLSGVESREVVVPNLTLGRDGEWRLNSGDEERVPVPRNVLVIGTVNVDETTYQFSPKILDRATTFEVRTRTSELTDDISRPRPIDPADIELLQSLAALGLDDSWHRESPNLQNVSEALRQLHTILTQSDDEFGFRVFYEARRLACALENMGILSANHLLDHIVLLKVLPRIHGSRRRAEPVLKKLAGFAQNPTAAAEYNPAIGADSSPLPMTMAKLERMLRAVDINQFVSFTD